MNLFRFGRAAALCLLWTAVATMIFINLSSQAYADDDKLSEEETGSKKKVLKDSADPNGPSPGHSSHGEAFDEGPRQAAYIMGNTGGPAFKVTTKSELAQQFIDQGVGQLHGFWYWEAERSFRQAAMLDPDCAMSYWGMAMANKNNAPRAASFIRRAMKMKDKASAREQMYITGLNAFYESLEKENKDEEAKKKAAEDLNAEEVKVKEEKDQQAKKNGSVTSVKVKSNEDGPKDDGTSEELKKSREELLKKEVELAKKEEQLRKRDEEAKKRDEARAKKEAKKQRYVKRIAAWEKLVQDYPEDLHAKAFLVYQIWEDRDEVPIQSHNAVDAILDQIFAVAPNHPAQHYRIHLWDHVKDRRAITAAALNGPAAPGIAHMWHMPGHTYSALRRYHDAVFQQEASARVDHAYMMRDHVMPYQIHNYAHNNEWCIRNMLTIGRAHEALRLSKNLIEIPRHPKLNIPSGAGSDRSAAAWGRDRLWETVTQYEMWDELLALSERGVVVAEEGNEKNEIRRHRYLGIALTMHKNEKEAGEHLQWIKDLKSELEQQKKNLPAEGIKKVVEKPVKAIFDKAVQLVSATTSAADGDYDKKSTDEGKSATPADDKKDSKAGENKKAPPTRSKREIDDLLKRCNDAIEHILATKDSAAGDHAAALGHAKKIGDLSKAQLVHFHIKAGQNKEALKIASRNTNKRDQSVLPRAALVEAHWANDDRESAKAELERLRKFAATADLDVAALERLKPIARSLGYADDWRGTLEPASDVGERPTLDSLGPLEWEPWAAEAWSLPDHEGKTKSLREDFNGKPTVVIFYLGAGCLHCIEQLNTFGPLAKEYEKAGINLVAISTDSQDDLKKTFEQAKQEGGFPFPILSDESKNSFKKYRCYDDFEDQAMHGTYLIDTNGKIRWQDIGSEPFTDAEFLLKESTRLLKIK